MQCKDKIIAELEKENHALKTCFHTSDGAMCDLRSTEHTLKYAIEDRSKLEQQLRAEEDYGTCRISKLDEERSHLKAIECDRAHQLRQLREELDCLRCTVGRKRDDIKALNCDFSSTKVDNQNMWQKRGDLEKELSFEKATNVGLTKELKDLDGRIIALDKQLVDQRNTIGYLRNQLDQSNHAITGLSATVNVKEDDNRVYMRMINEKNDQIYHLEGEICCRMDEVNKLKCRISSETESTNVLSIDKDHYAVRNSNLGSVICSLKCKLDDRQKELCCLRCELKDLNDLYYSKKVRNDCLEQDINCVSQRVGSLEAYNKGVGCDLSHAASREAYLYGSHCKAAFIHSKQRDYDIEARTSASYVDHVRANSPARSPHRRFY